MAAFQELNYFRFKENEQMRHVATAVVKAGELSSVQVRLPFSISQDVCTKIQARFESAECKNNTAWLNSEELNDSAIDQDIADLLSDVVTLAEFQVKIAQVYHSLFDHFLRKEDGKLYLANWITTQKTEFTNFHLHSILMWISACVARAHAIIAERQNPERIRLWSFGADEQKEKLCGFILQFNRVVNAHKRVAFGAAEECQTVDPAKLNAFLNDLTEPNFQGDIFIGTRRLVQILSSSLIVFLRAKEQYSRLEFGETAESVCNAVETAGYCKSSLSTKLAVAMIRELQTYLDPRQQKSFKDIQKFIMSQWSSFEFIAFSPLVPASWGDLARIITESGILSAPAAAARPLHKSLSQ